MIKGEYKKIILEIFDVLGYLEHEKEMAMDGFKKKFANEMLKELHGVLSQEQRQWIARAASTKQYDKNDPSLLEIKKAIDSAYPSEKLHEISRPVFKKVMAGYVSFVSPKIDAEKASKLNEILKRF